MSIGRKEARVNQQIREWQRKYRTLSPKERVAFVATAKNKGVKSNLIRAITMGKWTGNWGTAGTGSILNQNNLQTINSAFNTVERKFGIAQGAAGDPTTSQVPTIQTEVWTTFPGSKEIRESMEHPESFENAVSLLADALMQGISNPGFYAVGTYLAFLKATKRKPEEYLSSGGATVAETITAQKLREQEELRKKEEYKTEEKKAEEIKAVEMKKAEEVKGIVFSFSLA